MEVEIGGPPDEVLAELREIEGVSSVRHRSLANREVYTVRLLQGADVRDEISRAVIARGWSLLSMQSVGMTLEDIFLRLTTDEEN